LHKYISVYYIYIKSYKLKIINVSVMIYSLCCK